MANAKGTPIWFELMTPDPVAAEAFYTAVVGWSAGGFGGTLAGGSDYRVFSAPDGAGVGGMMTLPPEGPPPGWFLYIGVPDVDAAADAVQAAGGSIHMPPTDLPGVGRLAMVADPQGVAFYLMRGASPGDSHAFQRMAPGHGEWIELVTTDDAAALAFYESQFGWTRDGAMPMGPGREYSFVKHGDGIIGAVLPAPGEPPHFNLYFRTGDIDAAAERVRTAGGTVLQGPHEVPGGDYIIVVADPLGATFGLVGSR